MVMAAEVDINLSAHGFFNKFLYRIATNKPGAWRPLWNTFVVTCIPMLPI